MSEIEGIRLLADAPLQARNSFGVAASANLLADVRDPAALPELFAIPALARLPLLVLGAGSNVLFADDWPGLVLTIVALGITPLSETDDSLRVRVAAGENWNDFVRWTLARGFAGLENLSAIPGTVGAAPVQNIGAYGVEVEEFIQVVETWDRASGSPVRFSRMDCGFGYRDSRFKREPDRHLITAVEFELPRQHALMLDYAGIGAELAALGPGAPTPLRVAEAITRLRSRKLPDPALIGNAGSFFKNPLVDRAVADGLLRQHPTMPHWLAGEQVKLSAAWLIERCGFRGQREGDAGVSERHALVLVNHGKASGAQLLSLARRVAESVRQRFGIALQAEPRIIGEPGLVRAPAASAQIVAKEAR